MLKQVIIINSDLNMYKNKIQNEVKKGIKLYFNEIIKIKEQLQNEIYLEEIIELNDNYNNWKNNCNNEHVIYMSSLEQLLIQIGILDLYNTMLPKQKLWYNIIFDKNISKEPVQCMTGIIIEPLDEEIIKHHFKYLNVL